MFQQIILASQSPRRKELLTQMGLEYIVLPAQGEEHSEETEPKEYVKDLAEQKALETAMKWQEGEVSMPAGWHRDNCVLVIGADTVVVLDDKILGKPRDVFDAERMLHSLQGRYHYVDTGVALIALEFLNGQWQITDRRSFVEETRVTFAAMSDEEIAEYAATKDPLDKAGSYGIQGIAAKYITGILGDYNNVVGLPVASLYQNLKALERDMKQEGYTVGSSLEDAELSTSNEAELSALNEAEIPAVDEQERLRRQFEFLLELDKEKMIGRQTYLSDGERLENDAEHAWHMAVMALVLQEHANEPIDILRVISMILFHDVVEIDAGDTYAYDDAGKQTQKEREQAAADRIFALLPEDQQSVFRGLWDEFEARETPEAMFARAMDNAQPLMLNRATEGKSWEEHQVALSQVLNRNSRSAEGSKDIWEYAYRNFIRPSLADGKLKKDMEEPME